MPAKHDHAAHHFMLTFTVPEQLRPFIRGHQRLAYGALFEASAGAIKKLTPDPKYIGAHCPGFLGVLHTWGRQLQYHPHIHYLVPGGAVSSEDGRWHACSPGFYLPVHALSAIFRAKFRDAMDELGLLGEIPSAVWELDWNVNCQAVGSGQATLKYLARYVFKVAICDQRIVRFDDTEGLVPLPQGALQPRAYHGASDLRVHAPLPPARAAPRFHEGAPFRVCLA